MRFFVCLVLTVLASSARKDVSQAAPSGSVAATWTHHFNAVIAKDIDALMEGYTEKSEIKTWNEPAGEYTTVSGLDEIRTFNIHQFYDLGFSPAQRSEITDDLSTWTVWEDPDAVEVGTDTFIYDDNFKIIRQYIYIAAYPPAPPAAPVGSLGYPTPGNGSTQKAWDTHAAAWRSQNIEDIMLDYTEASIMRVFSDGAGPFEIAGLAAIRGTFEGIFAALANVTDYEDVLQEVDDDHQVVDWVWQAPSKGYKQAHETFIFDENLKIIRQNVVIRK